MQTHGKPKSDGCNLWQGWKKVWRGVWYSLSFEGAVGALLDYFDMLLSCLLQDKEGGSVVAGGLVKFISTYEFLAVSHLMADVMGIVCRVCRVFQREDLTFSVVKEVLDPACSAILGMELSPGHRLESFLAQVPSSADDSGEFIFGGNVMRYSSSQSSHFEKLKVDFIDQLVANLQSRFPSQEVFHSLSIFDTQLIPSSESGLTFLWKGSGWFLV